VFLKSRLLALSLLAAPVLADEAGQVPAPLTPARLGYAFADTDTLLRQRIFGLAHGVHLLLSACLDKNENAEAAQQAYDAWHATQEKLLDDVRGELAVHHYGGQASRVHWQDVARVLGLKETVYPSLGDIPLQEACATLPQALTQPRYNFAAQLEMTDESAKQ
jgi:hypothetical protein